jgi:4a-hydroxytetrahydrobiopterin dehydratase
MARPVKLESDVVEKKLRSHAGWVLEDGGCKISKVFDFDNFRVAFAFMTECALVAEKLDHHPDWSNSYSKVKVTLSTHTAGGLTELDFTLAMEMDEAEAHYQI